MTSKEKKKVYDAARYLSDPKKAEIRSRGWAKANPEKKRKSAREWYRKNEERLRAKASAYYRKNKKRCKDSMRAYRKAHPELDVVKNAKRKAREMQTGGEFTCQEWLNLCKNHSYKCLRCNKKKPLAADHVVPVSRGGTSNIDNIQPLCKECNSIKHTKTIDFRRMSCKEKNQS